jgi:hypothetical protein
VRVDAADILHKLFWGGGAVSLATSSADFHVLKCRPADKLEDGTVNFLDIISLKVRTRVCSDAVAHEMHVKSVVLPDAVSCTPAASRPSIRLYTLSLQPNTCHHLAQPISCC